MQTERAADDVLVLCQAHEKHGAIKLHNYVISYSSSIHFISYDRPNHLLGTPKQSKHLFFLLNCNLFLQFV